jgi:hypothetical protein
MSAEIFVFSDSQIGSIAEWQQAIEAEGFALRLSTDGSSDELSGQMAARFGNEDIGFEYNQVDVVGLMSRYTDVDFSHAWKFVRAFRSAPQLKPNVAAWIGAAIFAKLTGGKVFEPGADKLSMTEELLNSLRDVEHAVLEVEAERKELSLWPPKTLTPSPAVITVRLWKGEEGEDNG